MRQAIIAALALLVGCVAPPPISERSLIDGSDPVALFMTACAASAPDGPREIPAQFGWEDLSSTLPDPAPIDTSTTFLRHAYWERGGGRPDNFQISEWMYDTVSADEAPHLVYVCSVHFNEGSFEEVDQRLRGAGFEYLQIASMPSPRNQDSRYGGALTRANYASISSNCEVELNHSTSDPVGAPCENCRRNYLACTVDSTNLSPRDVQAWLRRARLE